MNKEMNELFTTNRDGNIEFVNPIYVTFTTHALNMLRNNKVLSSNEFNNFITKLNDYDNIIAIENTIEGAIKTALIRQANKDHTELLERLEKEYQYEITPEEFINYYENGGDDKLIDIITDRYSKYSDCMDEIAEFAAKLINQ